LAKRVGKSCSRRLVTPKEVRKELRRRSGVVHHQ